MPYKNLEQQRQYQREWMAKRRLDYFFDKACVRCGSGDNLQLDHVDPTLKISHKIWSWSAEKREAELAKCQVLCEHCHLDKTRGDEAVFIHLQGNDECGTLAKYKGPFKCRCDLCRKANADYEYQRRGGLSGEAQSLATTGKGFDSP